MKKEKTKLRKKRAYERPEITHVAIDVMQTFPSNCKLSVASAIGFGAPGACTQSSTPGVGCLVTGS